MTPYHFVQAFPNMWIFFLLALSNAYSFEKYYPPIHLNLTGIPRSQCLNDTVTWLRSLGRFPGEFQQCFAYKNSTLSCSKEDEREMIQDFYGVKQLDAFGKIPPGMLDIKTVAYGDLQECQEVSKHFFYHTKYCFIHTKISQEYMCDKEPRVPFKIAVCMPKSCSENEIVTIFNWIEKEEKGLFTACSATCKKDKGETDTFTWIFLSFMSLIVGLCLFSSVLDYVLDKYYQKEHKDIEQPSVQALLSFSIYTNGSQVMDTTIPKQGHLKSLDCIRFLSMIWVASGHVFNFSVANDSIIPLLGLPRPILSDTLMSAFFSVDTFFVLSGLLVGYMFFKEIKKNPQLVKSPLVWIMFYVHRYLRYVFCMNQYSQTD